MNYRILKWALLLSLGVLFAGCEKDEPAEPAPSYPVLGTYEQGGRTFDILQAIYLVDEYYYRFLFSADAPVEGAKVTSYCSLSIMKNYLGKEFRPEEYVKNLDYVFVYEDPVYYYSVYKDISGIISITDQGEDQFKIDVAVKLADGSDFKLNLDGVLDNVIFGGE